MKKKVDEKIIIGIDEAGRGPLAGPVSVAAILVNEKLFKKILKDGKLAGLTDSKKLSEKRREELFKEIKELQNQQVLKYSVALVGSKIIDEKGIAPAVKIGIKRILSRLLVDPSKVEILLDGSLYAPSQFKKQKTIIKGDLTVPVISAASIVAKVHRDRHMKRASKKFPRYLFDINKGYGTKEHIKRIRKFGMSDIHRHSFCKDV